MVRNTVLVVDPEPRRRAQLLMHLSLDFDVTTASSVAEALPLFHSHRPRVVLASLVQDTGNGLKLCRVLRERLEADASFLMVYGRPPRRVRSYERVRRHWRVDCFLPNDPEPDAIVALLRHGLAVREIRRRLALVATTLSEPGEREDLLAVTPSLHGRPASIGLEPRGRWHRRAEALRTRLRSFLSREFYLFAAPPKPAASLSELSWLQLLNSRISLDQLRELVKRFYLRRSSGAMQ